nr:MAG TPA: Ogr/Delta-like zinc finger protein [Caudoviricetes sp.]
MMNENVCDDVSCRYCGAAMRLKCAAVAYRKKGKAYAEHWYECINPNCSCTSPARKTVAEAYKAAMQPNKKENRVLSFREVVSRLTAKNDAVCCETRNSVAWIANTVLPVGENVKSFVLNKRDFFCVNANNGISIAYPLLPDKAKYGKTWRCWLRKPTPEEMANTPWEEKDDK